MKRPWHTPAIALIAIAISFLSTPARGQEDAEISSLYDVAPLWLVDVPTAGTLPRGKYDIGLRVYPSGGAIGFTDIGMSNRLTIGIAYGGDNVLSNVSPNWNPKIEFHVRFRPIDELEYFPAVTVGFASQGYGPWNGDQDRYTFKSRGFFATVSRSFYFYQWTAGWHVGVNYTLENDVDEDKTPNAYIGVDATFKHDLALLMEWDSGLNDDKSKLPNGDDYVFAGKGRGYLNLSIKWLYNDDLEIEALIKDLLLNRRESETITREIRLTYLGSF